MLFTSWVFIACFLPIAIGGYWLCCSAGRVPAILWLIVISLTFYGFWMPYLIVLIGCSIAFNYSVSVAIRRNSSRPQLQIILLWFGIGCDLAALIYYKYAYSLLAYLAQFDLFSSAAIDTIVLPLGISFFTFTQIGYLVDCKDGVTKDDNILDYVLFVTFFPHLIAGPILHNGEIMPQFANPANFGLRAVNLAPGLTLFVIGMLKKSLFADTLSAEVASGFGGATSIQFVSAWLAALAYSIQLYFDFSGYTDMAIGLALLFNIRFPPNFNSPYRAHNIIDFWQRWHMSLTRFLTQYLYNPIALTLRRRRAARGAPMSRQALQSPAAFASLVAFPTIVTMALAGIWHGAGITFLIFGLLHGVYLTVNHGWRMYGPKQNIETRSRTAQLMVWLAGATATYLAVLVGQIFFRSSTLDQAWHMLTAMVGFHGVASNVTASVLLEQTGLAKRLLAASGLLYFFTTDQLKLLAQLCVSFAVVWLMPNSQQIMVAAQPILGRIAEPVPSFMRWQANFPWAIVVGLAMLIATLSLGGTSEFLYFQF